MTINLSDEMIQTLRAACRGRLMSLRQSERSSKGDKKAVRMLGEWIVETQAALDMLDEMSGK